MDDANKVSIYIDTIIDRENTGPMVIPRANTQIHYNNNNIM